MSRASARALRIDALIIFSVLSAFSRADLAAFSAVRRSFSRLSSIAASGGYTHLLNTNSNIKNATDCKINNFQSIPKEPNKSALSAA